ncbi:MAG: hypothetical protein WHV44_01100 [Anaerolineales bacterium]
MGTPQSRSLIPIYTTRGEAAAFLVYPYLFNPLGEWVGFVTANREVYSVLGYYVGFLSKDPRILRKRSEDDLRPRLTPPPAPPRIKVPPTVPLARLMSDLSHELIDVLEDEPHRLHTPDSGELRQDMD